jgi:predicted amidophosphoribosyltransferase
MPEQLKPNTCLNCEQHFSGDFCSTCGQKASTQRFDLKHILQHLPHELFHLDQKGILKNIMSIIRPPGNSKRLPEW